MAPLKTKGDLAEMMVAADILRRGHKIAFPFGEDWDYDLIVCRHGALERVQVKHARSDGAVIAVRCSSHSLDQREGASNQALHAGHNRLDCRV